MYIFWSLGIAIFILAWFAYYLCVVNSYKDALTDEEEEDDKMMKDDDKMMMMDGDMMAMMD